MSNILVVTGYDCTASNLDLQTEEREHTSKLGALEEFCRQFGASVDWRQLPRSGNASFKTAGKSLKGEGNASSFEFLDQLKAASAGHRFLLIYQSPEAVFATAYRTSGGNLSVVNAALEGWAEANRSILSFFQKNREKSVLVNICSPQQYLSDFRGVCRNLMGQDVPFVLSGARNADSMLEAFSVQVVENFGIYQELYGKLQLSASLPGADLDQSTNTYQRGRYIASLAATSLLAEYEHKESLTRLKGKRKELEEELEISSLQIQQLQEELEHYFVKCEQLRETSNRETVSIKNGSVAALSRSLELSSAVAVEIDGSYSESGYRDIHLKLRGLALSDGRHYDHLSCKLALKAGKAALEFRANGEGMGNILSIWPEDMHDEYGPFLLFMPVTDDTERVQQKRLLLNLSTEDRQLVFGVVNVLRDHFASHSVQGIENLSPRDVREWRLAAIDLAEKGRELNWFISVDEVQLREEFVSEGYSHLWFECSNLQFGKRIYPSYSFKFSVAEQGSEVSLALEFRALSDNNPPLEAWPSEISDEYGHKLHASLSVDAKVTVVGVVEQLTATDKAMLSAITQKLPALTDSLIKNDQASKMGWDFWKKHVVDLDERPAVFAVDKVGLLRRAKARLKR